MSAIARQLDLDRETVRGWLALSEWQPYRREETAETLLSAHMEWLKARAPQMRYSARILYQEVVAQRDYAGGYD